METPVQLLTHHVKARRRGGRRWLFITGDLKLNSLRIHAARFSQKDAEMAVASWAVQDPEFDFKTAPIGNP